MAKKGKGKGDEETEGETSVDPGSSGIRLSEHPGAARSIPRVRSWGGLIGFAVTAYVSHGAGLPFIDVILRALLIGTACSLVAWFAAQMVWRQIAYAELAAARKKAVEAQRVILDELEQQRPNGA